MFSHPAGRREAVGTDQTGGKPHEQHQEQRQGDRDSQGERLEGAFRLPLVANQIKQSAEQGNQHGQKKQYDQPFKKEFGIHPLNYTGTIKSISNINDSAMVMYFLLSPRRRERQGRKEVIKRNQ